MFWHKRTVPLGQEEPPGFAVDKILDHQMDENGEYKFLVQKRGQKEDEAEFIDASDFISPNAQGLLEYCRQHDLGNVFASGPPED